MKKIFALVAFCLAFITTQAAVPAAIQSFVKEYNTEIAGQTADGIHFGRATIEGNNLIIPMYLDDSELQEYGMGLSDAIELMGGTEIMEGMMLLAIFEDADVETDSELAMFKQYQYNIVFRMIGTSSKDRVDLRIHYQDL